MSQDHALGRQMTDRRGFIRATALGLFGASLLERCATTHATWDAGAPLAEAEVSARFDGIMEAIRHGPIDARVAPADASLLRQGLASLFVAGTVRDVGPGWRRRPELATRVLAAMPDMDHAVFGMTDRIERLGASERFELAEMLRRDPDAAQAIADVIATPALALGVPEVRVTHLRQLTAHAVNRLTHQPPSLLLDDTVAAIRRLEQRAGWTEAQRAMMAGRVESYLSDRRSDSPPDDNLSVDPSRQRLLEEKLVYSERLVTAGAIVLGLGGVTDIVGGLALGFGGGIGGAIALTVGSVAIVVGLIILIVGLVKRRNARNGVL